MLYKAPVIVVVCTRAQMIRVNYSYLVCCPVHQIKKSTSISASGHGHISNSQINTSTSSPSTISSTKVGSTGVNASNTAGSFLVYSCNKCENNPKSNSIADNMIGNKNIPKRSKIESDKVFIDAKKRRMNSYAVAYSSLNKKLDGNQGIETLIYFPPVFPFLHSVNNNTFEEVSAEPVDDIAPSNKRKNIYNDFSTARKKMRSSKSLLSPGKRGNLGTTLQMDESLPLSIIKKDSISDLNLITASDADFMDTSNDFFGDDFLPDLHIDKDTEIAEERLPEKTDVLPDLTELDEDFGLLGDGKLNSMKSTVKKRVCSNLVFLG